MADSKVDLCNMALVSAQSTAFISSLQQASQEAKVCERFYEKCVRETLESADWPFATTQASLALSSTTRLGYEYAYDLPPDCARPLWLLADGERVGLTLPEDRKVFDVQRNAAGTGRLLLTDHSQANDDFEALEYVSYLDVDRVSWWPALFVDAVVWLLGSWCALGLKKSAALAGQLRGQYHEALARAAAAQLQGIQEDAEPDPPSVAARS